MHTLKRAIEILDYIVKAPNGITATEISKHFGMSLSNACKYLSVFTEYGYLRRNSDKIYYPGFKLLEYGSIILRKFDLRDIAHKSLIELMAQTGQTVHLIVKDGFEGVYIDKVEGVNSIPMVSKIGMRAPFYSTSAGKAILAHMPMQEFENYLSSVVLKRRTNKTIVDPNELRKEIIRTRERGYAIDDEESEAGIRCIGAAILNHEGYPIAAVSISGATSVLTDNVILNFGEKVVNCAKSISEKLGYKNEKRR
ncbi:MAG: IclR family transcriptional regulator [Pseudothermotoga sp.]